MLDDRTDYPCADLVAVNKSGEMVLVACANETDGQQGFFFALGRLVLMMDRDFEVNSFGLPQPNPHLKPPLIRYILAVPTESDWPQLVQAIPERIRKMLHLNILRVSDDGVTMYLPGVAVN